MRLSQTDLQRFKETGRVEEELRVGSDSGEALTFSLVRGGVSKGLSATVEKNRLTVMAAEDEADVWSGTERVGMEEVQTRAGSKNEITILIEKDFACLTPRPGEDEKDSFPHPKADSDC